MIRVNEIFQSISGEVGKFRQGETVVFVRLAGCNLKCKWCDTPQAQDFPGNGEFLTIPTLLDRIKAFSNQKIIITGGEPFFQKKELEILIGLLMAHNYKIQIETNGSYNPGCEVGSRITFVFDYKTPSSGMESKMLEDLFFYSLQPIHWIKFVIDNMEDFEFAKEKIECWKRKRAEGRVTPYYSMANIAFSPTPNFPPAELYSQMRMAGLLDVVLSVQIHKYFGMK